MTYRFSPQTDAAIPLHIVDADGFETWVGALEPSAQRWVDATGFNGGSGQACAVPNADGSVAFAAVGVGTETTRKRGRFHVAKSASSLPEGAYRIEAWPAGLSAEQEALGWLLAQYRFEKYRAQAPMKALLVAPEDVDATRIEAIAAGEVATRDLINTPASDMGPNDLEAAAQAMADQFGATLSKVEGDALLDQNFPMIHTVGRAANRAPRLLDLRWGQAGPTLTLVGKGVCFDTGGLNLKPGASMGLMKKDMGGAAAVLGLAQMIMATGLPVQLRVLIPAVENSVAGPAFRPQDILTSRKGLTVEVNNTDAEGRLVLADALALADEEPADLLISMATLTGAARVAVGPDIAPFYTDDDDLAAQLSTSAASVADPVWRMPFHDPYEPMIEPGIADLDNAPMGGFAGSITAALFLRRFVETSRYMHFDIYGWQPSAAPGRPKGGVGQGTRALFEMLPKALGL